MTSLTEKSRYSGKDLAFIIPTRNRPDKVRNLLASFARQSLRCGRIIVVASGADIGNVVDEFSRDLPVEYCHVKQEGQIYQRNKGISLLDDRTPLAGSLDDDIVLEPGALENMVNFWNRAEAETAGVSFNIVNNSEHILPVLQAITGLGLPGKGRVFRSGYHVAGSPADDDLKAEWLCGGATVWKKSVFDDIRHPEIECRWAVCEDLIFSYPVGKRYPLYVCAGARVRHEHVQDHLTRGKQRYYGRTTALWRLYFVESQEDLSRCLYFCSTLNQVIVHFVAGAFLLKRDMLEYAIGLLAGALAGGRCILSGGSLSEMLGEPRGR